MVPFAGWLMPVQYSSILEEHSAVRKTAGLFDVSHMGELIVEGPQAAAFLDHVLPQRIANLRPGRARYSCLCDEQGGVIDDLIVYRMAEENFFICVNASNRAADVAWLEQQIAGFDATLADLSDAYCLLAVQGPAAEKIVAPLLQSPEVLPSRAFRFAETTVAGVDVLLSRTGYTGEDGFECYVANVHAEALAGAIVEAGKSEGLQLVGLGARDSLRLEAGLPLHGHELSREITPLMAGLGWTVKLEKAEFIGREALARQDADGVGQKVIYGKLKGRRIAREGTPVLLGDQKVGRVLSGSFSPILEQPIASALVDAEALAQDEGLTVDLRGKTTDLVPAIPPLHRS